MEIGLVSNKILRCISVKTAPEAEDLVSEVVSRTFDAATATWHDLETQESTVSAYVELTREKLIALKRILRAKLKSLSRLEHDVGSLKISARRLKPDDWSKSWKRHFKPIEIGNTLLLKPSWSKRKPRAGAAVLILDPGLSFGTGQHPTTRFCLETLASARTPGSAQSFLDIGTGTGVLAIAAEKLGYVPVKGFDFDPVAIRVARENASENGCEISQFAIQDLLGLPIQSNENYDVICANLIYDVLLEGQKQIINRLKESGILVLAGILTTQFQVISRSYESTGMCLVQKTENGEWTSGSFRFDDQPSSC